MIDTGVVNPLIKLSPDGPADFPIAELKQHLTVFVADPPGPKTVKRVLDLYFSIWGDPFSEYCSTSFEASPEDWNNTSRRHFYDNQLLELRKKRHWGYSFSDGRTSNSWSLMFHGYFPFSEPDKASFFRFEFDWQVDSHRLKNFVSELLDSILCLSAYGGFVFQRHRTMLRPSYDQIYAWARRYWGVEAQDLDVTVSYMKNAFKCVNWITIIGEPLAQSHPEALKAAKHAAYAYEEHSGGILFQTNKFPSLGDRHREWLTGYAALAKALEPLQVKHHAAFGEGTLSRWTEESTNTWLRRFTEPERVV